RLRRRQRPRGDGSDVPARWQHVVPPREPPRRVLARSPRRRAGGHAHPGVVPDGRSGLAEDGPGPAAALASARRRSEGRVAIYCDSGWPARRETTDMPEITRAAAEVAAMLEDGREIAFL